MKDKQVKTKNMLRVYDRLRQSPVTLDVLHDWIKKSGIDVSRRTLYRYLDGLAESIDFKGEKLVVYNNEFNKKVWKIEFDESAIMLNQFDINSYYILRNFISRSLSGPREASLKKLDQLVYGSSSKSGFQVNVAVNNLAFIRTNYIDADYDDTDHKMMEEMIWAIQHQRKIQVDEFNWDIRFLPEDFKTGTLVMPLKLVFHFGLMYLCVYAAAIDKICVLPIIDIIKTTVSKETFTPTKYYPLLDKYLANTFGMTPNYDEKIYDIEIEFAGSTGYFIKSMNWHSSQSFEQLANGNIMMRLHCGLNRELIGFILYFLNNAKVMAPNKLRKMVIEKLKDTLQNYAGDDALVYETNMTERKLQTVL